MLPLRASDFDHAQRAQTEEGSSWTAWAQREEAQAPEEQTAAVKEVEAE